MNCAAPSPASGPSWRSHSTTRTARTGGRPRAMYSRTPCGWPGWPRVSWFWPGWANATAARPADQRVDLTGLVLAEVGRHDGSRVPVLLAGQEHCAVTGDADGLRRMLG